MCEVTEKCRTKGNFWVQTRREIEIPASEYVEPGTKSGRNITACARHLPVAVRSLGELNRNAIDYHQPATDGVIVKTRHTDPETNTDFWV